MPRYCYRWFTAYRIDFMDGTLKRLEWPCLFVYLSRFCVCIYPPNKRSQRGLSSFWKLGQEEEQSLFLEPQPFFWVLGFGILSLSLSLMSFGWSGFSYMFCPLQKSGQYSVRFLVPFSSFCHSSGQMFPVLVTKGSALGLCLYLSITDTNRKPLRRK